MKKFLFLALLLVVGPQCLQAGWQEDYARLLKKYVGPAGVRYAPWKANPEDLKALESVVEGIGAEPASAANGKEELAFFLNAYNAWILHEALEKYPLKTVNAPPYTFFFTKRITVAGQKMSFNTLEQDIIRPRFKEARIHFALNCASRSCPSLRSEPYSAATLESQLEQQTRAYINSPAGVAPAKDGARISKIFEWYKDDFEAAGGTLNFLNKRLGKPLPPSAKLTIQDYDWSLNEVR